MTTIAPTNTPVQMELPPADQIQSLGRQPEATQDSVGVSSSNDHSSIQQTGHNPTDSGRETSTKPTHKEVEALAEERAMENPDYAELKAKLEACAGLEEMFHLIDKNVGWRDDSKITLDDILALVNDTGQKNIELRAAGKWLNDHRSVLDALKGDDNLIGVHDVKNFIAGMKAELKGLKDTARAEIKEELGVAANAATAAGGGAAATATNSTNGADPSPLFKAPALSTKPGMEGAVENVNNTLRSIGNAVADLSSQLADPKLTPEKRAELQARFNELQQLQSMLTNMYKQLQEAIANMMKMYSDVAQNSIRNMK